MALVGSLASDMPEETSKKWKNLPSKLPKGTEIVLVDGTRCTLTRDADLSFVGMYSGVVVPERVLEFGIVFSPNRVDWELLRVVCPERERQELEKAGESLPIEPFNAKCTYCQAGPGEPCVDRLSKPPDPEHPELPAERKEPHLRRQAEAAATPTPAPLPDEDLWSE